MITLKIWTVWNISTHCTAGLVHNFSHILTVFQSDFLTPLGSLIDLNKNSVQTSCVQQWPGQPGLNSLPFHTLDWNGALDHSATRHCLDVKLHKRLPHNVTRNIHTTFKVSSQKAKNNKRSYYLDTSSKNTFTIFYSIFTQIPVLYTVGL